MIRGPVDTAKTDEGIDLEASEVEADANRAETNEKVNVNPLLFGYMFQKGLSPDVTEGKERRHRY